MTDDDNAASGKLNAVSGGPLDRTWPAAAIAGLGLAEHRGGENVVADAPAAVGDLLDEDHGVRAGLLTVDLGV